MDPIAEHVALLDDLIRRRPSIGAANVRNHALYDRAQGYERFNEFVGRLSERDRGILADMLQDERINAHFDALVWLHDACAARDLKLFMADVEIPPEPFGYTMFEEYLTVLEDGDWRTLQGDAT